MIKVNDTISIDEDALQFKFIRASGPGGQNVNKVASAVQLRFHMMNCPDLSDTQRSRLVRLAGQRMTETGVLLIDARRFRSQERNRADAIERLCALIRQAATPPTPRRPTRPSRAGRERRLASKRHRAARKQDRRSVSADD